MLGAIAAVALVVGTISATVSVTRSDRPTAEQDLEPVVEVQAVQSTDSVFE